MKDKKFISEMKVKENIFLLMALGWAGIILFFSNTFQLNYRRQLSYSLVFFALFFAGVLLAQLALNYLSAWATFLICLVAVSFFVFLDCSRALFFENAIIHLSNAVYIGNSFYFLIMQSDPEKFSDLWHKILPSAPPAFEMLILCLLFQNAGYYIFWELFYPFTQSLINWAVSSKNLINLNFVKTSSDQVILFLILTSFGLISRLWNLSLGRVYYTEGSGIPFYISSFLAQFDRLYVVAWLYGYALSLKAAFTKNTVANLTWILIPIEFLYQLLSGSKGRFFSFVILPLASVFILVRQRISWRAIFLMGGAGIFSWLVVYPTLVIYRNLLVSIPLGASIDPVEVLKRAFDILSNSSSEKYIETILTPLNQSGIAEQVTALTSIIHYQVSQEGSLLWQRLFLFWVPRFLWPDKPVALSANLIGRLSHRLNPEDFTTSVLTTGPGELFLYYGFWGSSLMIFTGLLLRWLNEAISPFKVYTTFRVAVLVGYLPLMQGILSGSFESGLTGIVLQIGVIYTSLGVAKKILKFANFNR